MKKMKKYYDSDENDLVTVYEKKDVEEFKAYFNYAENRWYEEWVKLGSKDEGTCCGGKGIKIRYRGPRKRNYVDATVIYSPPCQGNLSASESVKPALEYLEECGIEAEYYDGWMD